MPDVEPDRYDETRHAWLRAHPITNVQKRRAQLLNQQVSRRARHLAGAGIDPADDNAIPALWVRKPTTTEAVIVATAAVLAPIGWPLGLLLYRRTLDLIPRDLPAYPIAALLWCAIGTGATTVLLYWPTPSLLTVIAAPWLTAQIPATFAAAAIYGILNGWLPISTGWWPTTPPPATSSLARGLNLTPNTAPRRSMQPILWGAAGCVLGTIWLLCGVITTLLTHTT